MTRWPSALCEAVKIEGYGFYKRQTDLFSPAKKSTVNMGY